MKGYINKNSFYECMTSGCNNEAVTRDGMQLFCLKCLEKQSAWSEKRKRESIRVDDHSDKKKKKREKELKIKRLQAAKNKLNALKAKRCKILNKKNNAKDLARNTLEIMIVENRIKQIQP